VLLRRSPQGKRKERTSKRLRREERNKKLSKTSSQFQNPQLRRISTKPEGKRNVDHFCTRVEEETKSVICFGRALNTMPGTSEKKNTRRPGVDSKRILNNSDPRREEGGRSG